MRWTVFQTVFRPSIYGYFNRNRKGNKKSALSKPNNESEEAASNPSSRKTPEKAQQEKDDIGSSSGSGSDGETVEEANG